MLVKLEGTGLQTSIYAKLTDKNMYIHAGSEHPNTRKRPIPYGLAM